MVFFAKIFSDISGFFEGVVILLVGNFFTSSLEDQISVTTRSQSSMPIKMVEIVVLMPDKDADLNHQTSSCQCLHLIGYLRERNELNDSHHCNFMSSVRAESKGRKRLNAEVTLRIARNSLAKL